MIATADHHIHLGFGDFRSRERSQKYIDTPLEAPYNNLLLYRDAGITYLRDGGDKDMLSLALRRNGADLGITVKSPGRALVKKDCYGRELGLPISTVDELKRELDFLLEQQVDHFKIVQSGLVAVNGRPQNQRRYFDDKMLGMIMDCAKENHLPVMVHVNFPEPIKTVVDAGVTTIEHGYFITEDLLLEMKKRNIAWTPTLSPFANAITYNTWISGWNKSIVAEVVTRHKAMVKKAVAIGVDVLLGSDAGGSICPHGRCTLDEYRLLSEILADTPNRE
ncbi:MAG: amidohydrolase family protein [Bacillota bacterium]|nr:amidohydrolase family protein [Bacillota bacterium]